MSNSMLNIKTEQNFPVLSLTVTATLANLVEKIACHPDAMLKECEEKGLNITGPMVFVYRNADCEMDKPFQLELVYRQTWT